MRRFGTERALRASMRDNEEKQRRQGECPSRRASRAGSRATLHLLSAVVICFCALVETNCGTTQSGASPVSVPSSGGVTVTISPGAVNIPTSGAQIFSASLSGGSGAGASFTWSVNSVVGG